MRMSKKQEMFWRSALAEQRRWVEARGGSQAGYRALYGSYGRTDDECDAIYRADMGELRRLEALVGEVTR